ncbi:MAG: alpha/beta hydrolase [Anaerolineales bacterium]
MVRTPKIKIKQVDHYYELHGTGPTLVFVHGAFVDADMWVPQIEYFSSRYRVLTYDLRGHGRTGVSDLSAYGIVTFTDDLAALLDVLEIENPILCGLSLGGMIAQSYAVQYPERLKALVLADTAVSVNLTLSDKLQRYVLFPRWAMLMTIRMMSMEKFTRFSFWLARATRSGEWFGEDKRTQDYVERCMLQMNDKEYLKIYGAIYDFKLQPLEKIRCPTLVLNGEHESKSVFRHTEEILRRVPQAEAEIVPGAGHTSNMENPEAFNRLVGSFLKRCV